MRASIFFLCFVFLYSCKELEPRKPVNLPKKSELQQSIELNKQLFGYEQELIEQYIKLDTLYSYTNSHKGFWYSYIHKKDKGVTPVKGNTVTFEQEILALDGAVLYDKDRIGQRKYVVDKEHIMKGLKEGIKLMKVGEEMKFIFSSFVAFRMNGDNEGIIRENEPIICKLKLIEINNN